MNISLLSRQECSFLKGIAIMGVIVHNYCHLIHTAVKENEFNWLIQNVIELNNRLKGEFDSRIILDLFSYFGSFFLPIFVFLSGYGLVCKHEDIDSQKEDTFSTFFIHNFRKLFLLLLVGYVAYIISQELTCGYFQHNFLSILGMLSMTVNILCCSNVFIEPGPFWYFGLTIQLYMVYRLFLYRKSNLFLLSFTLLSLLLQIFVKPDGDLLKWYKYNIVGSMMPFCLGIYLARIRCCVLPTSLYILVLFSSLIGMWFFPMNYYGWLLTPAIIIIGSICFVKICPMLCVRAFSSIGRISMYIFIFHPTFRAFLYPVPELGDLVAYYFILYIVCTLIWCYFYSWMTKKKAVNYY